MELLETTENWYDVINLHRGLLVNLDGENILGWDRKKSKAFLDDGIEAGLSKLASRPNSGCRLFGKYSLIGMQTCPFI